MDALGSKAAPKTSGSFPKCAVIGLSSTPAAMTAGAPIQMGSFSNFAYIFPLLLLTQPDPSPPPFYERISPS
jgi:hypothetical protein